MKVDETSLLALLNPQVCFKIPVFQRNYSWTPQQCRQLFEDIKRVGSRRTADPDGSAQHFVGPVVYVDHQEGDPAKHERMIIDGQQRITTVTLLLHALARSVGPDEPVDGFTEDSIRANWIINAQSKGPRHYKLHLSPANDATLRKIIGPPELHPEHDAIPSVDDSPNLWTAFTWFQKEIADDATNRETLQHICNGLLGLRIIHVKLIPGLDNPQMIFESMNSTGLDLAKSDLVRNYLLMDQESDTQTRLYEDYWNKMENIFAGKKYRTRFDRFLRHYVTVATGYIPPRRHVYREFKAYCTDHKLAKEEVIADLHRNAEYFEQIESPNVDTNDPGLRRSLYDLGQLGVDVCHPLLLRLFHAHRQEDFSATEFTRTVRLIESYVFRRAVCDLPTAGYNMRFATLTRSVKDMVTIDTIRKYFAEEMRGSRYRFPEDEEFRAHLLQRNMYDFRSRPYWLWRLENHNRKDPVPQDEYSVEHIMPQTLTEEWKQHLGPEWEATHDVYRHQLGNLTLIAQNPDVGNMSFEDKLRLAYSKSPLHLNDMFRSNPQANWDRERIIERGAEIAKRALHVWPSLDRV